LQQVALPPPDPTLLREALASVRSTYDLYVNEAGYV
jgi:hypothetical protein